MDLRSWKNVLLQWVSECNFAKNTFMTLEQSDPEDFFRVYTQHAQVPLQSPSLMRSQQPLHIFLQVFYPDYAPRLDSNGRIVPSDYIYVYTLLMHYTCVQVPSEYFHTICKRLPDRTQRCIVSFFEQTVERPGLTRERLRQAFANVARIYRAGNGNADEQNETPRSRMPRSPSMSPNSSSSPNITLNSSGSEELETIQLSGAVASPSVVAKPSGSRNVTPVSTPLNRAGSANSAYEPPTPKTELLEQRMRELFDLRALLETERYEKHILEEQIMDNEQLITTLNEDNQIKKQQLSQLKAKQNEDETEVCVRTYVPNESDHLKKRLLKEINKKELIIAETKDKLTDLNSEKSELNGKLKMSEKQLKVCMDRIGELESRTDELAKELSVKADEIVRLQSDKVELEQCLQETRDAMQNRREILNASSDFLDSSSPSSGSMNTTPENLATSVIDKQLREREQENQNLRAELQTQAQRCQSVFKELCMHLREQAQHLHLEIECESIDDEKEMQKPEMQLKLFLRYTELLGSSYEKEQLLTKELYDQSEGLSERNSQLVDHIELMTKDMAQLRTELKQAQRETVELHQCKVNLEQQSQQLQQQQESLQTKLRDLQVQLQQERQKAEADHRQELNSLRASMQRKLDDLSHGQALYMQLQQDFKSLQSQLQAMTSESEDQLQVLVGQLEQQREELAKRKELEHVQKENYDKLAVKHEELRQSAQQTDHHLDSMHKELEQKEVQMVELGIEIMRMNTKNTELEQRINALLTERSAESALLQQKDLYIAEMESVQRNMRDNFQECKAQLVARNHVLTMLLLKLDVPEIEQVVGRVEQQQDALAQLEKRLEQSEALQEQQAKDLALAKCASLDADRRNEALRTRQNDFVNQIRETLRMRECELTENVRAQVCAKVRVEVERSDEVRAELKQAKEQLAQLRAELEASVAMRAQVEENNEQLVKRSQNLTELQEQYKKCVESFFCNISDEFMFEKEPNAAAVDSAYTNDDPLRSIEHYLQTEGIHLRAQINKLKHEQRSEHDQFLDLEQRLKAKCGQLVQLRTESERARLQYEQAQRVQSEQIEKLLQTVERKEADLLEQSLCAAAELQQERDTVGELMGKLASKMEQLEAQDVAAIEMLAHIAEHVPAESMGEPCLVTASKFTELRTKLDMFVQSFKQLQSSNDSLEGKATQLDQQLSSKQQKIEDLQVVNEALSNRFKHLNATIKNMEDMNEQLNRTNIQMKAQLAEQAQKLCIGGEREQGLNEELQQLRERETQLLGSEQQLVAQLRELRERCQQLELQLETESKDLSEAHSKLHNDHTKLREQHETATKRIERMAIKMGEQQGDLDKLQRYALQYKGAQAHLSALHTELRQSKKNEDQLQAKLASQQRLISEAEVAKTAACERLAKQREVMDRKLADYERQLTEAEHEKVGHIHHIGGLNSDIEQRKRYELQQNKKLEELQSELQLRVEKEATMKEQQQRMESNAALVSEQLNGQLQKLQDASEAAQSEMSLQLVQLREQLMQCHEQIDELQHKLDTNAASCEALQTELQLKNESLERLPSYVSKLSALEQQLAESNAELCELRSNHNQLCSTYNTEADHVLDAAIQERTKAQRLERDCQILQVKYREAKEEMARADQRLKDQRLEMEGKLEKMKSKMDGPHSLDDSMSALLSTTAVGSRKKSIGTHYKRPGPPTPSKNGGRLSFGGSTEPPREILRETCDGGGNAGSAKTPARFKIFASRFSMGGGGGSSSLHNSQSRDEKRTRNNLLARVQRRNMQGRAAAAFCTSTPRKSRSSYDQQRLISKCDAGPSETHADQSTPHLPLNALPAMTGGGPRRLRDGATTSSGSSSTATSARRSLGGTRVRKRGARVSLCLHGNIFVKGRPFVKTTAQAAAGQQRAKQRNKARQQRDGCFDQGRQLGSDDDDHDELEPQPSNATYALQQHCNNNYSLLNRNDNSLGATVVLNKDCTEASTELSGAVAATFNVTSPVASDCTRQQTALLPLADTDSPRMRPRPRTRTMQQQLRQFESDHVGTWLRHVDAMGDLTSNGDNFEQLCRETVSTAPFALQLLQYSDVESSTAHNSAQGNSNTTASSTRSCTIYSQGYVRSQRLPHISVTTIQRPSVQPSSNQIITAWDLWRLWPRMDATARFVCGLFAFALLLLCYQMGGPLVAAATAITMIFLLLVARHFNKI